MRNARLRASSVIQSYNIATFHSVIFYFGMRHNDCKNFVKHVIHSSDRTTTKASKIIQNRRETHLNQINSELAIDRSQVGLEGPFLSPLSHFPAWSKSCLHNSLPCPGGSRSLGNQRPAGDYPWRDNVVRAISHADRLHTSACLVSVARVFLTLIPLQHYEFYQIARDN